MNPFFTFLKDSGTQAMLVLVGTVAALVGAVAAVLAAKYGKEAPTQEDLKRVEENTAHLEEVRTGISQTNERLNSMHEELAQNTATTNERLVSVYSHLAEMDKRAQQQQKRDELSSKVQHISVVATGRTDVAAPMQIMLQVSDADVVLTHVLLLNEHDNSYGSCECKVTHAPYWAVAIDAPQFQRWYGGGTMQDIATRRRVKLRVYFLMEGQEVSRELAVTITQGSRAFSVDGSC